VTQFYDDAANNDQAVIGLMYPQFSSIATRDRGYFIHHDTAWNNTKVYLMKDNGGDAYSNEFVVGLPGIAEVLYDGSNVKANWDGTERLGSTSWAAGEQKIGLGGYDSGGHSSYVTADWVFLSKFVATEPAYNTAGEEEETTPSASTSPSTSASQSPSQSPSTSASQSPSTSASQSPSLSPSTSVSVSPSFGYQEYTKGEYVELPTGTDDLTNSYTEQNYIDVSSIDDVFVGQDTSYNYTIHQFKEYCGNSDICTLTCVCKTNFLPSLSPVYLQIYNRGTSSLTQKHWETVATNNTAEVNTSFTLSANIFGLNDYKDENTVISCRVYQQG
jgi:hypothetical protein